MQELGMHSRGPVLEPPPAALPTLDSPVTGNRAPLEQLRSPAPRPALAAPEAAARIHPAVFVDPRTWTLLAARSLQPRGTTLVMLSSRRLEPAVHARGVQRHHLPSLALQPERWQARLLELAALLEPRPALFAGSAAAFEFLQQHRRLLEPHFTFANLPAFEPQAASLAPDAVLRQTLLRGEAALEVQIVRDAGGRTSGLCVLAWALGAPPDVVVTSVEGADVTARSEDWMAARRHVGYARLIWAPDRFGRLSLHAASPLFGAAVALAQADGVDFPALCYAAATGGAARPQRARGLLSRRLALLDPEHCSEDAPLVDVPVRPSCRDPLPWFASLLRGFVRP